MPAVRSQSSSATGFVLVLRDFTLEAVVVLVTGTQWSVTILNNGVQVAQNTNIQANQLAAFVQAQLDGILSVRSSTGALPGVKFAWTLVSTNPLNIKIATGDLDVTPWPPVGF